MGTLHELWDEYKDRVAFYVVYIREAHPEDGWVMTINRDQDIQVTDPKTHEEREDAATSCALRLKICMPVLIDSLDDSVARAYGGWPDRLYLIGKGGKVAFQGEEGPFGFAPDLLRSAIDSELATHRA